MLKHRLVNWIIQFWYRDSWLTYLLIPLSYIYLLIFQLKKFNTIAKKPKIPTIVVGNLTIGGNGKTPLVKELAKQLTNKGFNIAIITRGYKHKLNYLPYLIKSSDTANKVGDEPYLLYNSGFKVIIDYNRNRAITKLSKLAKPKIDLVISDDGLQHFKLKPDFSLIIIDAQQGFGNGKLLPAGPLREPINRLSKVDALVINGILNKQLLKQVENLNCNIYDFSQQHYKIVDIVNGYEYSIDKWKSKFNNNKIVAITAIANSQRFFNELNKNNIVSKNYSFIDHYNFTNDDIIKISNSCTKILMTEKDAVKIKNLVGNSNQYFKVLQKNKINPELIDFIITKLKVN